MFPCGCNVSPMGTQTLGFSTLQPFGVYPLQAYVPPGDCSWLIPRGHQVAAPPTALGRGEFHATHSAVPMSFHQYGGAYSFGCSAMRHTIPLPSLHGG